MDKALLKEWVSALRRGRFKQGVGRLMLGSANSMVSERKYCCLGVLCEIHPRVILKTGMIDINGTGTVLDNKQVYIVAYGMNSTPPPLVRQQLGLDMHLSQLTKLESSKRFKELTVAMTSSNELTVASLLMYMNDVLQWTFVEIADWIEEVLLDD